MFRKEPLHLCLVLTLAVSFLAGPRIWSGNQAAIGDHPVAFGYDLTGAHLTVTKEILAGDFTTVRGHQVSLSRFVANAADWTRSIHVMGDLQVDHLAVTSASIIVMTGRFDGRLSIEDINLDAYGRDAYFILRFYGDGMPIDGQVILPDGETSPVSVVMDSSGESQMLIRDAGTASFGFLYTLALDSEGQIYQASRAKYRVTGLNYHRGPALQIAGDANLTVVAGWEMPVLQLGAVFEADASSFYRLGDQAMGPLELLVETGCGDPDPPNPDPPPGGGGGSGGG